MSATIIYSIVSGAAPFTVQLIGSDKPSQFKMTAGVYSFPDVECGEYTIRITDRQNCVFDIPVLYPCPEFTTTTSTTSTTTSTTSTTTTTEEPLDEYPCNYLINYYGEEYSKSFLVNLGFVVGAVILDFNAFYIPVKITVEFDGIEVINTGYRGNASYQSVLDTALTALGEPTETIGTPSQDSEVFIKGTMDNFAKVTVFAPLEGSIASIKLKCPTIAVTIWKVAFMDRSCEEAEISESTTTTTIVEDSTTTTTEESTTTTTSCVPEGLLYTRNFYGSYSEYSGSPIIDFHNSEELACIARNGVINEGYSLNAGIAVSADKFYIGWEIFPRNCSMLTGYYIFSGFWNTTYENNILVRIINNVIVQRIECPEITTTTSEEPSTTTSTDAPVTTTTTEEVATTTTTEIPVTTTTTEEATTTTTEEDYPSYYSARSAMFAVGECGDTSYPFTFDILLTPGFVAGAFPYPGLSYSVLEYIEIVSVDVPVGLSIIYNGSPLFVGQKLYTQSEYEWTLGSVDVTRSAEGQDDLRAGILIKIKLNGYALSETVEAGIGIYGCYVNTTTTTEEPTTTTTT